MKLVSLTLAAGLALSTIATSAFAGGATIVTQPATPPPAATAAAFAITPSSGGGGPTASEFINSILAAYR